MPPSQETSTLFAKIIKFANPLRVKGGGDLQIFPFSEK